MENIIFDNKSELLNYIKLHYIKALGIGREGASYLMDNGLVLKHLYDEYTKEFALKFKDMNIESFVFAKSGVLINDYINAIFMEYIKGFNLLDKNLDNKNILMIGNQLQKLVEDIKKISELGILVKDFFPGNVIYNDNGFKVIDTMCYLYLGDFNYQLSNLREIMNKLYDYLIKEIYICKFIPDKLLFLGKTDILLNPLEYLKSLKEKIEEIGEQEIMTLGDAKKILIKNRK